MPANSAKSWKRCERDTFASGIHCGDQCDALLIIKTCALQLGPSHLTVHALRLYEFGAFDHTCVRPAATVDFLPLPEYLRRQTAPLDKILLVRAVSQSASLLMRPARYHGIHSTPGIHC